jgi:mono/diheme cytochrome c family protein
MKSFNIVLAGMFVVLASCGKAQDESKTSTKQADSSPAKKIERKTDPVRYTRGLKLYQQNCASCHGKQGEGAENWRERDAEGKFRPPPLNGTGHTWHHPMHVLMDIIRNGTQRLGGNMPPWKDKLSDAQVKDILFWVQSQWTDEIYARWYENNQVVLENKKAGK